MKKQVLRGISLVLILLCVLGRAEALEFSVSYPAEAFAGPFSGRVVVYLSQQRQQPRFGPNWFNPEPAYSLMFRDVKPGKAMVVDDKAVGFPGKLSQLPKGEYFVQAVIDHNLGGRAIGSSPGNLYSDPQRVLLDPASDTVVTLICKNVITARAFRETERVKEVRVESKLLSTFYGRKTMLNASVTLPEEWSKEPERKFPIIYEIPGFGGRHYSGRIPGTKRDGEPFIMVVLDPDCPGGHSVFADSANNGPWGQALITELIPEIEKRFRAIGTMATRYVTGHSSGGWSSLWLQVTYPDTFGGCWSTSPDPVDFRDFQQIDIYRPDSNMFTDSGGQKRPLARDDETPTLFYRGFSDMERPIRGEQLGSFEYAFSPRGPDGEPRRLWDRDTGKIDQTVAEAWKKYDIGLTLRTRWKEMETRWRGKIHVYMGDMDTFYLEGAVKLLQKDMKALGADAKIELFPGDHGSVMTPALRARIDREMAAQYRRTK